MHLEHEFVVPQPVQQAWQVLLDIERIAPCLPGATVDSVDGDTFTGRVKVKVGPIQVTYGGTAITTRRRQLGRLHEDGAHGHFGPLATGLTAVKTDPAFRAFDIGKEACDPA